ncbi:hypothetical protein ICE98_02316 [Lactococcus lactis]|nr:hypothetical protein [Lactococcus lactis]
MGFCFCRMAWRNWFNSDQTAQQVVNQLNGVTGFHAYNHNPYGSGGTPND